MSTKTEDVEAAKGRLQAYAERQRVTFNVPDLRTLLASHAAQAERIASLEAGMMDIKRMKAEPIGDTGFQTGPAVHFAACQRIARALLSGKDSA